MQLISTNNNTCNFAYKQYLAPYFSNELAINSERMSFGHAMSNLCLSLTLKTDLIGINSYFQFFRKFSENNQPYYQFLVFEGNVPYQRFHLKNYI